ncbi:MAG: autotransporter-associated beta strand repeat-containing protein, partial [Verrucomicrobiales bacterium]|nr:autotransporter-associated beta strand repeat-containing protein [Verrucomicrobiales bacterium]
MKRSAFYHWIPVRLTAFVAPLLAASPQVSRAQTWNQAPGAAATYSWSLPSNWTGILPDAPGAFANFGTVNPAGNVTINVDGTRTVGSMLVGDINGAQSYSIISAGTGGGLIWDNGGLTAQLDLRANDNAGALINTFGLGGLGNPANTFALPMELRSSLNISTNTTSQHVFRGPITGSGALSFDSFGAHTVGTQNLIGQISLQGLNRYTGGTTIGEGVRVVVEGGVGTGTAMSFGTGTVTVDNGGQALLSGDLRADYRNDFVLSGLGWNEPTHGQLGALRSDANAVFTGTITLATDSRLASNQGAGGVGSILNGVIGEFGGGPPRSLEFGRAVPPGGAAMAGSFNINHTAAYTGATTVSTGTLRIGAGDTFGSIDASSGVTVAAGANLAWNRRDFVAPTIAISGAGNFAQNGIGILLLNNGAGYLGTTTVNGQSNTFNQQGALVIGNGGAVTYAPTGNVALSGGADLMLNTSSTVQFGGGGTVGDPTLPVTQTVVGAGNTSSFLIQQGTGTTILSGSSDNGSNKAMVNGGTLILNKHTTGTSRALGAGNELGLIIRGGTVQYGADAHGDQIYSQTDVEINGGVLDLNGKSDSFDVLTGGGGNVTGSAGTLTLGEHNSTVNNRHGALGTGFIHNGTGTYPANYGGAIGGGLGLTKIGTGAQTLSGTNTYTGATTINGGTLVINGSTAAGGVVDVNAATLSGMGSVGTVNMNNAATSIRPGADAGDMTIGTLTAANINVVTGGDYRATVNGSVSDLLNITGNIALNAASTVTPVFASAPVAGSNVLVQFATASGVFIPTLNAPAANSTRNTYALTPGANTLSLDITGANQNKTWVGNTGTWSIGLLAGTNNWSTGGGDNEFGNFDATRFDDTGITKAVTVPAGAISAIIMNNSGAGLGQRFNTQTAFANDYTFTGGAIVGYSSVAKTGSGVFVLNSAGNTFEGAVSINDGILRTGNNTALGTGTGQTFVSGTGTLDFNGQSGFNTEVINIAGDGYLNIGALINTGAGQVDASRFVALTGDARVATYAGGRFDVRDNAAAVGEYADIGNHTLTKVGAGQISLVGVEVRGNGGINIAEGILGVETTSVAQGLSRITVNGGNGIHNPGILGLYNNNNGLFTSPVSVMNNGSIREMGSNNLAYLNSPVTLNGGRAFLETFGNTSTVLNLTGGIVDAGGTSLVKSGSGRAVILNNASFSSLTVTGGTIDVGDSSLLNTQTGNLLSNAAGHNITAVQNTISPWAGQGSLGAAPQVLHGGNIRYLVDGNVTAPSVDFTQAGGRWAWSPPTGGTALDGGGNLSASGSNGILTVTGQMGTNPTVGTVAIERGIAHFNSGAAVSANTLQVGYIGISSGSAPWVTVNDGAKLNVLNLMIADNNTNGGYSGFISQTGGSVTVLGSDTQSGNADGPFRIGHWPGVGSTYDISGGALNVPHGSIDIGTDQTAPAFNVSKTASVMAYGLEVDGRGAHGPPGGMLNLSGGATIAVGPGGIRRGNGGATNSVVNVSGGTIRQWGNDATWGAGAAFANSVGTLDTNGYDVNVTGGLVESEPGSGFTKAGAGHLILSQLTSATTPQTPGNTVNSILVRAGTLSVVGNVTNTGTITVTPGGTLSGSGNGTTTGTAGNVTVAAGATIAPGRLSHAGPSVAAPAAADFIGTVGLNSLAMNGDGRFNLSPNNTVIGVVNDLVNMTGTTPGNLTFSAFSTVTPVFNAAPTIGNNYVVFQNAAGGTTLGLPGLSPEAANSGYTFAVAAGGGLLPGTVNDVVLSVTGGAN